MNDKEHVLRVSFRQSAGQLAGACWCGRTYNSDDPKDMWSWLDEHQHAASESLSARFPVPLTEPVAPISR